MTNDKDPLERNVSANKRGVNAYQKAIALQYEGVGAPVVTATGEGAIAEEEASSALAGQRTEISIRRTLEANKSRLYALYNRALRKDPFLKGKVMFEIEIQPNGAISRVDIKSSGLNNAKLERQLTIILRSIRFPEEEVSVMTTIWAIEFLPN